MLALLSVARGAPAPTTILDRFDSVSARAEATQRLQALAASTFPDPQGFDARMTLHRLEEVPDCLDH
ncbi:hypothetical protein [Roseiarcus fermentans]|uniref:hypothetical protein n=1 Tax=Roseiarcus fermentans TaxID=1473586 RepID=UPI001472CE11|nr:hypothetical protein [Roseiarcus fermentans]